MYIQIIPIKLRTGRNIVDGKLTVFRFQHQAGIIQQKLHKLPGSYGFGYRNHDYRRP